MSESATPPTDLVVDTPAAPLHVEPAVTAETAPEVKPESAVEPYPPSLLDLATPKPVETVPETAPEKVPEKPAEAKPPEAAPEPAGEKPPEPAPEVKYEFKLPEGFTAPKEALDGYTGVLKEGSVPPEIGQKLLDMHLAEMQRAADSQPAQWRAAFARTMQDLVSDTLADPQLGGAGHQTAMTAAARGRDTLTRDWTPDQKAELEPFLQNFGVGNHKVFLRLLYSAARFTDEPAAPPPVYTPAPTNGARPGAGFKALYDHPGSAQRPR